jgi:predicted enzyme related to lactoylglutathione lyase
MTTSKGPWPGRFVWHDLMTTDAEGSLAFYGKLFDWSVEAVPMMGTTYHMIHCGPGPIGGVMQEKNIPGSHWMPYLAVDDVDRPRRRSRSSADRFACRRRTSRARVASQ